MENDDCAATAMTTKTLFISTTSSADNDDDNENVFITTRFNASKLVLNRNDNENVGSRRHYHD